MTEERAKYSAEDLRRMAANGQAMSGGRYPIADREDLTNAIRAVGRGSGSHDAIRRHIMKRARALGLMDLIPDNWMGDGSMRTSNDEFESRLLGVREERAVTDFELRAGRGDWLTLDGYASVFDVPYEVRGGPDAGGWTEIVDPKAFNRTLSKNPDVHLLMNHQGASLARTKAGTLNLTTDGHGLRVRADLNRRDPDVQALEVKMELRNMDEMSFAFRTIAHDFNKDTRQRRLTEVSIDGGDVSVVNNGANSATTAAIRSLPEALAVFEALDTDQVLAEVRSDDDLAQRVAAARAFLDRLVPEPSNKRRPMSVARAKRLALLDA